jgi:hypothetical protein
MALTPESEDVGAVGGETLVVTRKKPSTSGAWSKSNEASVRRTSLTQLEATVAGAVAVGLQKMVLHRS